MSYVLSVGVTTYRLPDELTAELDRVARRRGVSRTLVVREALSEYLASDARAQPSLVELADGLVTYEGSGVGDLATRSEQHLRAKFGARRRPR